MTSGGYTSKMWKPSCEKTEFSGTVFMSQCHHNDLGLSCLSDKFPVLTAWECLQFLEVHCSWLSCMQSPLLAQWKTLTGSSCWYPLISLQISMRGNVVEGVLAAACQVGVTAPYCKGYQTALLLQISVTGKSPSDQLWEPEAKQGMSLLQHQAKVSEPRQIDGQPHSCEGKFCPCPLLLMRDKSAWGKKLSSSSLLQSVIWFTPRWSRFLLNELEVTRIFLSSPVPASCSWLKFTFSGHKVFI